MMVIYREVFLTSIATSARKVVPEMGDPTFYKNLTALEAGTAVLNATEGIKGYEELRTQTAKMISSAAASVEKTVAGRIS
jgi:hypothetical protein